MNLSFWNGMCVYCIVWLDEMVRKNLVYMSREELSNVDIQSSSDVATVGITKSKSMPQLLTRSSGCENENSLYCCLSFQFFTHNHCHFRWSVWDSDATMSDLNANWPHGNASSPHEHYTWSYSNWWYSIEVWGHHVRLQENVPTSTGIVL